MYIFLAIFLMLCGSASADQTVFFDKNTKEVKFIVEDASSVVLSAEDKSTTDTKVIKGNLQLDKAISDYKVSGNDIVINTQKISKRNKDAEDAVKADDNRKAKKLSAINKLKALGLDEDEISAITGRN